MSMLAGPSGLAVAASLARQGVSFRIVGKMVQCAERTEAAMLMESA